MAVEIKSRHTEWLGTGQLHDWPLGNVGDWKRLSLNVKCTADYRTRRDGSVSIIYEDTKAIFILDDGSDWKDWGIHDGDGINLTCRITRVVTSLGGEVRLQVTEPTGPGGIPNNIVNGNELIYDEAGIDIALLLASRYPSTTTDVNNVETQVNLIFQMYANTTNNIEFDEVVVNMSLIENDFLKPNSLNSIIDGSLTGFRDKDIKQMIADDTQDMVQFGNRSGMAIRLATLSTLGSSQIGEYRITIEYMIHGFFQTINNFLDGKPPTYFENQKSLAENFEIQGWPFQNDRNISVSLLNKEIRKGNIGWIGENFNGNENHTTISDTHISDQFGNVYDSVPYNVNTVLTFNVVNSQTPLDAEELSHLGFGIMHVPKDTNDYKGLITGFLDNFYVNALGIDGDGVFQPDGAAQTHSGWGLEDRNIEVIVEASPNPKDVGKLLVRIEIKPNAKFTEFMESKDDGDRLCYVWFSSQYVADLDHSDRTTETIILDSFEKALPIVGEYNNLTARFITHPYTSTKIGDKTVHSKPNDDLTAKLQIWLPNADEFKLTGITYAIEAIKTDDHYFQLERVFMDTSQSIILDDGTQQINVTQTRGFKLASTNEKNKVSLIRDMSIDAGSLNGYSGLFGWKNRWEDWLPLDDVNNDFFDETKLNNGYNNDWARYSNDNDWEIYFVTYLHGTEADGNEIIYRNTHKYFIGGYDDNDNIVTEFFFKNAETGEALVGGQDDITEKNLGIILADEQTNFEIHFTLQTGVWTQEIVDELYATATIEVDEGPGELSMRQISTEVSQEAGNPLVPLTTQFLDLTIDTDTTKLIATFNINPVNLDVGAKYRFTGRLGCGTMATDTGQYNEQYNEQYD